MKKNKEEQSKVCQCETPNDASCTCTPDCNCHDEAVDSCTCGCGEECHCQDNIINELNEKIKVLEDTILRTHAEMQNYRKRKDEETAKILKYAEEDVLKGFLPIVDNFERAIAMDDNNFGDETSKFLEGFRLVYNQTRALLEKFEVKEIDCLGKKFDPTYAEAISTVKRPDLAEGVVAQVYQKGYMYKDKILRTAMVIVNE